MLKYAIIVAAILCSAADAWGQGPEDDAEAELLSAIQNVNLEHEGDWFAESTLGPSRSLRQCRGLSLSISVEPLQVVDTLNGITWKGLGRLEFVACRTIYGGNVLWSEWAPEPPQVIRVMKKRGTWRLYSIPFNEYRERPTPERVRAALQRGMKDERW